MSAPSQRMFKRWVMPLDAALGEEHLFATGRRAQREPPRERRAAGDREQETKQNRRHVFLRCRWPQDVATQSSVSGPTSPHPCISGSPPRFTTYLIPGARPPVSADESGSVGTVRLEKANPSAWGSPLLGGTRPGRRMTGEHRGPLSASPRRIGALGSSMIVSSGPVHRSLNRWFTRTLHSDEGSSCWPLRSDN